MILVMLMPSPIEAQKLSFSISPPLVEAVMKPGKSIVIAYTVANLGDPMIVSARVGSFQPQGIYGSINLSDQVEGPARFNLENSKLKLGKQFFLKSKEGQQLLLKIRLPEGTPEGDYYYTFYVQNDLGRQDEGTTAAQAQALVGSNILITVTGSGDLEAKGGIGEFSILGGRLPFLGKDVHIFESTDLIPVQLIIQNAGRNLIKPIGSIHLRGNFGERADFDIIPENILSQSSRLVHATPSASIDGTSQSAIKNIKNASLFLSGFFVGKYTLTTDVNFGVESNANSQPESASATFYAVPFKLLIALGVALVFGWAIVKKFRQDEHG